MKKPNATDPTSSPAEGLATATGAGDGARTPNDRTRGMAAIVEGLFACMWFSWMPESAPPWLTTLGKVGAALAVVMIVAGIVVVSRATGQPTPTSDPATRPQFVAVLGAELAMIVVGVIVLNVVGLERWTPVWACAVVGLHFWPLARVVPGLSLVPLSRAVLLVAACALVVSLTTSIEPSAITGPLVGLALLSAAGATLARRVT